MNISNNKGTLLSLFLFLATTISLTVYFLFFRTTSTVSFKKRPFFVAVSRFMPSRSADLIIQGFEETLHKSKNADYDIKVYEGRGDRLLVRSQIEEIVIQQPDLIATIGTTCSLLGKEITIKREKTSIPIVFSGVQIPTEIDLVESEECSGNHLTGTTTISMSIAERVDVLLKLKPSLKEAVIAYHPDNYYLEKDAEEFTRVLESRGINVLVAHIFHPNEVKEKMPSVLDHKPDVVILLNDSTVNQAIDTLVKLCNKRGVTIFSPYLDDAAHGAAISLGMYYYQVGAETALVAQKILEEKIHPSDIPITSLKGPSKLIINTKTMKDQGLDINPALLFIAEHGQVLQT